MQFSAAEFPQRKMLISCFKRAEGLIIILSLGCLCVFCVCRRGRAAAYDSVPMNIPAAAPHQTLSLSRQKRAEVAPRAKFFQSKIMVGARGRARRLCALMEYKNLIIRAYWRIRNNAGSDAPTAEFDKTSAIPAAGSAN